MSADRGKTTTSHDSSTDAHATLGRPSTRSTQSTWVERTLFSAKRKGSAGRWIRVALSLSFLQMLVGIALSLAVLAVQVNMVDAKHPYSFDSFGFSLKVYHVIYIFGCVFQFWLLTDSMSSFNTMQLLAFFFFQPLSTAYVVSSIFQAQSWWSWAHPNDPATAGAMELFTRLSDANVATAGAALVSWLVVGPNLYFAVGWGMFERYGANRDKKRRIIWHHLLILVLKLDLFFALSFGVQRVALGPVQKLLFGDPTFQDNNCGTVSNGGVIGPCDATAAAGEVPPPVWSQIVLYAAVYVVLPGVVLAAGMDAIRRQRVWPFLPAFVLGVAGGACYLLYYLVLFARETSLGKPGAGWWTGSAVLFCFGVVTLIHALETLVLAVGNLRYMQTGSFVPLENEYDEVLSKLRGEEWEVA